MSKRYFHVTDNEGFTGIVASGVINPGENGKVCMLAFDKEVSDAEIRRVCAYVAWSQCYIIRQCHIFEIDSMGLLVPPQGEFTAEVCYDKMVSVPHGIRHFRNFGVSVYTMKDIRLAYRLLVNQLQRDNPDCKMTIDYQRCFITSATPNPLPPMEGEDRPDGVHVSEKMQARFMKCMELSGAEMYEPYYSEVSRKMTIKVVRV
jgi:hypothetical protein